MVAAGKWISPPVGTTKPSPSLARRTTMSGAGVDARLDSSCRPDQPRWAAAASCRIVGILRVEVLARARGRRRVAVAVDRLEVPLGDPLLGRRGVDAVQRELPGEQRGVGLDHRLAGLGDLVVADRRHREGVVVVAEGVRADDGAVDAAVPALPDPAEAVDQEVVADVAPAAGLHVVGVDAAQDARAPRRACSRWRSPCGARSRRAPRRSAARTCRASARRRPTGRASRSPAGA